MKLEKFIAIRYLKSKHKINFITIISLLSVLGITIGVSALIVVISVFNGFGNLVTNILVSFDPHIKIESNKPEGFDRDLELENFLEKNDKVLSFSPFVGGKSVVYSNKVIRIINLIGISCEDNRELSGLKSSLTSGNYDLKSDEIPKVLLGLSLSSRLQVSVGDTIVIVSPDALESYLSGITIPSYQTFVVSGIYNSHNNEIDAFNVYVELSQAQRLLNFNNKIYGYEIRLKDIKFTNQIQKEINKIKGSNVYTARTWFDLHKDLYSVMIVERWSAYVILSLIIAVATFSIFSSLLMTVIEKKRDIGVLKALGLPNRSLLKIFLFEGVLIGVIGSLLGVLLGLFVCYIQMNYKLYSLDPTVYIIDALPVYVNTIDVILIGTMAVILAIIASYIPARKAIKLNPVDAIKWE